MDLRDRRTLFSAADETLARDGAALRQVLLLYIAILTGLSLLLSGLTVLLSNRIETTGGLSGMGLRSILSTVQSVLPMVQTVVLAALQLGYTRAILNARRGEAYSRDTLWGDFRLLLPLMGAYLLQGLLYAGLALASVYAAGYIFMLLPASNEFMALIEPLAASVTAMSDTLVLSDATYAAASEALRPMLWIFPLVFLPLFIPTCYRYRMTVYCLLDQSRPRPMLAMRESRMMLHRNRTALFKLDLQLWWYYILQALVTLVCYGDQLLTLTGVALPFSPEVSYFLFLGLSLLLQAAVFYFTLNRVSLIYAAAYDSLLETFEQMKQTLLQRMNIPADAPANPWKDQY